MKRTPPRVTRLFVPLCLLSGVAAVFAPGRAEGALPVIDSFTSPDPIIRPEGLARLQWSITGADSATITPNIGGVSATTGLAEDSPEGSITYTLRAVNEDGAVTATVRVEIPEPIGVSTAAWSVRQSFANISAANGGILNSLTRADQVLNAPVGSPLIRQATINRSNIEFIDYADSAAGVFGFNRVPPGGGSGDNFTLRCSGTLVVNEPGVYTFGINNDDGGRLLIDLNKDGDFFKDPAVTVFNPNADIYDAGEAVIVDNGLHGPTTTTGTVTLQSGTYAIEYTAFEQSGGMAAEVFYFQNGEPRLITVTAPAPATVTTDLIISEFLTENQNGLRDADGSREDWIEIFNGTAAPVALENYWLSDDATKPTKWRFPAATLAPGGYRVVFASDKNTTLAGGEFHTNFKLSQSGEHLGLYKSDGAGGYTMVSGWLPSYPAQHPDRSHGRYDTELHTGYFITPTPGAPNNGGYDGFTPDVKSSLPRGLYSSPQSLTLTVDPDEPNPELFQIRYTTNGSEPGVNNGTLYVPGSPIPITKTVALRTAAVRSGWKALDVDTHTYLFLDDVVSQTVATARETGFPTTSVNGQVYRYGMNATLANTQRPAVRAALAAIPSVSLVVPQVDFSAAGTGIYSNARTRGLEVKASVELLNEGGAGTGQFQIDCGLRVRGGFSRDPSNPKHAFRLFFRNAYDGALEWPLFQGEGAGRFERMDLRTSQNYSWAFQNDNKNTFLREELSRDLQGAMGQPYSRVRYLHLYINGIYWGLYDTDERFDETFGEAYLGGAEDNYDVVKSAGSENNYLTEATQGALDTIPAGAIPRPGDAAWSTTQGAWRVLWNRTRAARATPAQANAIFFEIQGLQPDGKTPLADGRPPLLDVDNLIDYMLLSWYCGSFDAPLSIPLNNASNNWFGIRNPETRRGFVFVAHDFEHGMVAEHEWRSFDRLGPWGGSGNATNLYNSLPTSDPLYRFRKQSSWQAQYNTGGDFTRSNPAYLHEDLAFGSSEYRVRMWDRAHRHLFNNGALTDAKVLERMSALQAIVDSAIFAEQARWGNTSSLTRAAWLAEVNYLKAFINRGSVSGQPLTTNYGRANTITILMRGYMDGGSKPLYSPIDAPVFSLAAGAVEPGAALTMTIPGANTPAGTIHYTLNGEDPRAIGGAVNTAGGAQVYTAPITVNNTATVKARVWNGTTWSALMESVFITAAPASAANLVITELNYHPADGPPGDAADAAMYEFVELQNVSAAPVDLTGAAFVEGIIFTFPQGLQVPAGERVVVVRNRAGFQSRYPDSAYPGLSARIAGEYSGGLSASGERLLLKARDGSVIRDFTYTDTAPWPMKPDGGGPTLVFTTANPLASSAADPLNWRSHATLHGNPGGPDIVGGFTVWAAAAGVPASAEVDSDGDGVVNLIEYALGGNPASSASSPAPMSAVEEVMVSGVTALYQTFTFTRPTSASDTRAEAEASTSLDGEWSRNLVLTGRVENDDGTETVTYRAPLPWPAAPRLFMRLRVTAP